MTRIFRSIRKCLTVLPSSSGYMCLGLTVRDINLVTATYGEEEKEEEEEKGVGER